MLLAAGGNPEAVAANGLIPIQLAELRNNQELTTILEAAVR